MNVVFYLAIILGFIIIYHHAVYPLLLKLLAHWQSSRQPAPSQQNLQDADLPSIHLILPAFNEAAVIGEKLRNIALLDYPADKLKVTLVGDGCTDNTIKIAEQVMLEPGCAALTLDIQAFTVNKGKIAVLNQTISASTSDIVALSDISALINVDGLRLAAKRFVDPAVGVVNSSYHFAQYSSAGEAAYWQYQSKIKQMESITGSVIGAHGALYFFRRVLFTELLPDTINDDFILPMTVVGKGFRAVHEAQIEAVELECVQPDSNNNRRKRIAAGNLQQVVRLRHLLLPSFKGVAFNFLSGKVLRVFMPPCLILFYFACLALATGYISFALLALGQTVFYGLAYYQHVLHQKALNNKALNNKELSDTEGSAKKRQKLQKLIGIIYYFAAGHWYSFVGMTEYLLKTRTFKV